MEQKLNIKIECTIKSCCDEIFSEIMSLDDITPQMLMNSLSVEMNRKKVFRAGESAGKSGSFFFFSFDNKFLIKTLRGSEKKKLLSFLPEYLEHIKES
jgi:1-phosphatidylinositol-4-phosphate 5-kinase